MRKFTDKKDNEWFFDITIGTVSRVKKEMDLDILDMGDESFLKTIAGDPMKLGQLIYVLLRDQVEKAGIKEEDFYHGFSGDTIDEATDAFLQALVDFFPKSERRTTQLMLAKTREVMEKSQVLMQQKLNEIDTDELTRTAMSQQNEEL